MCITQINDEQHMEDIIYDEETNASLFDLSEGRVFRSHILRRSNSIDSDMLMIGDLIIFNFHHIAFDGSSIEIFLNDLYKAYSSADQHLECDSFDYIDYSIHERQMKMDDARDFWKKHLDGFSNAYLSLPYDRLPTETGTRSGRGYTCLLPISDDLVHHLLTWMEHQQVTLHQLGLTVFYIFLFKLAQETDLVVLTLSENRHRAELEHVLGVFVNTLPYRVVLDPELDFVAILEKVKNLLVSTFHDVSLPFQVIASDTSISNSQVLFDVDLQHDSGTSASGSDICLCPSFNHRIDSNSVAKFDLSCTWSWNMSTKSMTLHFNGSTDVFDAGTIELIARRFETLLHQIFLMPMRKSIYEYSVILPDEIELLNRFNHGEQLDERDCSPLPIHQQFTLQAHRYSQKLSIVLDEQSLTYAELFYLSKQLANHLVNEYDVKRGDIVGQCVERSIEMSIGIMGILFSNACYVPFSAQESVERMRVLISLVSPKCILVHRNTQDRVAELCRIVNIPMVLNNDNKIDSIDTDFDDKSQIDDTAFCIFTSGSTGLPKVIPISHQNFNHLIGSYASSKYNSEESIIIQMSSCTFDEHTQQCLGSICIGGTLVLLHPDGNLDIRYLCETIEKTHSTIIDLVPTSLSLLCDYLNSCPLLIACEYLRSLRLITVGGKTILLQSNKLIAILFRRATTGYTCQKYISICVEWFIFIEYLRASRVYDIGSRLSTNKIQLLDSRYCSDW